MPKVNVRMRAAAAAAAVVCALSLAGGCGMVDTGVRVVEGSGEGATNATTEPPSTTAAKDESLSVDPVAVLRDDPGVGQDVTDMVAQPCAGDEYNAGWFPLYTRYTTIAGTDIQVVIIDVQDCGDVVACEGVRASYVYRLWENRIERVYTPGEPMAQVTARGGELFVQRPTWERDDPPTCPSGSDTAPLTWTGSKFEVEGE